MLSFGQEESGDCSSSICLERMVSRVSVTPQHETIAEAVDVIAYLKLKGMKRCIEEVIAVDGYDAQKEKYIIRRIA